jgi:glycosyltransferase involved in cell wall biosynthesis
MILDVSVVIPTYRRADLLERCLRAVADQDLDPGRYEVIVADDAGEPSTRKLVERIGSQTGVAMRYVAVTATHGPAAARNAGWRVSTAPFIAFTDDDCVPERGWLRAGVEEARRGAAAVTGRVVMPLPKQPTDYERDASGLTRAEFVTANCFCLRSALDAVGGFDERFAAAWREDSDLQFSLLEKGLLIRRSEEAVVVHPIRPASWGVSLRQQAKSQFNALLYRKHPRLFRERIPGFPTTYLVINACLVACVVAGVMRMPSAALPPFAVWCALTARFCWKRLQGTTKSPEHVAEMLVTSILIPPVSLYWHVRGLVRFGTVFW